MSLPLKFNGFANKLSAAGINLNTDTVKMMLTNTAPVATNTTYSDVSGTELASGAGYTTGGATLSLVSNAQSGGVNKTILTCANPLWTATASMGPFRYGIAYSSTSGALMASWDAGSSITLSTGQTFTPILDQTNGVLQIA